MTKADFRPGCQDAELRTSARWIRVCLMLGTTLAAGFGIMTMSGGNSVPTASAAGRYSPASVAAEKPVQPAESF